MSNTYQIERGATKTFTITVTDKANQLVDLTNARVYFTVRNLAGDVVLTKANVAGGGDVTQIAIPDQIALKGQCYLKLAHPDSDIPPTARWADCWVVTATEYIQVDKHAPFYVTDAETRAFPTP